MAKSNDKMVANNKKAYHDYFILDKIENGNCSARDRSENHSVWENAA